MTGHPNAEIAAVTSRSNQGELVSDIYPNLRGIVDFPFVAPELDKLSGCDVVFFATPHGVAQSSVPGFLEVGIKVIDLSADFRLRDTNEYLKWYGCEHQASKLQLEAVYGLT